MYNAIATPSPAIVTNPPPCDNRVASFEGIVPFPIAPVADAFPDDEAFPPIVMFFFPPAAAPAAGVGIIAMESVLFPFPPAFPPIPAIPSIPPFPAFPVASPASAEAVFSPIIPSIPAIPSMPPFAPFGAAVLVMVMVDIMDYDAC
jgi:hypothetical protein